MVKKLFYISIFVEIGIILLLVKNIFSMNVLGTGISTSPISFDSIDTHSGSDFKYFYESKPNIVLDKMPSWLTRSYKSTINSDGLNERFDYPIEKDTDTYRIVTIGDSFTFGAYVDTKDNYPEQLEDLLNNNLTCKKYSKFEVINLGLGGYDLEYAKERFARRGIKYDPDLVLWFLKDGNFDKINEVIRPIQKKYRKEIEESGTLKEYESRGHYYPHTQLALKKFYSQWSDEKILEYQRHALYSFSPEYTGSLFIFSFPHMSNEYKHLINDFLERRSKTYYFDEIPNIYILDGTLPDGHPNKNGYTMIAQNLFSYLLDSKIVSCY